MANAVNALAFLHDGQTLAMAGDEGNVALWDVLRRQEVGFLKTHGATFQSLALAPDRHQIATGGVDGAIRLWDLKRAASITRDVSPSDVER